MIRKRATDYPAVLILVSICLLMAFWAYRQSGEDLDFLTTIVRTGADSGTDRVIADSIERARRHPDDSLAWVGLGEALVARSETGLDCTLYSQAEEAFRKAIHLDPNNLRAANGLALVASGRRQVEKAVEWAQRAVALDPESPTAYGLLGDAALEEGDYESAFQHYQKMHDLRPDLSSYSRGANILFLTGDIRKALWMMQRGIKSDQAIDSPRQQAQLALLLWKTGALLPAEQLVEQALQKNSDSSLLLLAAARIKTSRQEHMAAISYYERAAEIAPGYEAITELGDVYLLLGRREEAEMQFERLEELHRLNQQHGVQDQRELALFYADHDRNLSEALKLAREDYEAHPNIYAADVLAWCLYKNGGYQEARKLIREALRYGTPEATMYFHAGMIFARLEDRVAARNYLYKALSLNPHFHPIHSRTAAGMLRELGNGTLR